MSHLEQVLFGQAHRIPYVARLCGVGFPADDDCEDFGCTRCHGKKHVTEMHLLKSGKVGTLCERCSEIEKLRRAKIRQRDKTCS